MVMEMPIQFFVVVVVVVVVVATTLSVSSLSNLGSRYSSLVGRIDSLSRKRTGREKRKGIPNEV